MVTEKKELTLADIDIEALRGKENPTPQDLEMIAEHARLSSIQDAERENETDEQRTEREKKEKEAADAKVREGLDARAKEVGLEEGASEEDIVAKEKELGKHKESEEEKADKEEKEAKEKEELEAEVKAFAEENKVSEEEARKELEHIAKVGDKYEKDPKKLSKALLSQQRENVRLQKEIKEASVSKGPSVNDITIDVMVDLVNKGQITQNGKVMSAESIVQQYKERYEEVCEGLDDEKVLRLAAEKLKQQFVAMDAKTKAEIKDAASKRRTELLDALPESDKKYIPDIKPFLDNAPDVEVIGEDYSLEDFVFHAKGKHLEAEKKAEYDRGYKKGLEEKKIIAKKGEHPKGSPPVKTDTNASKIAALTDDQKKRALEMYDIPSMTTEKKYLAYIEYLESDPGKK